MKRLFSALMAVLMLIGTFVFAKTGAEAKSPTDEIISYTVTVSVNDDATLEMVYDFKWKVLEDLPKGTELQIGIPNSHWINIGALTKNITNIKAVESGYETFAYVYLDRAYKAGEMIDFGFELTQDYMYEMNVLTEGETVFYFTPGWFKEIAVDLITVRWEAKNAIAWSSSCFIDGDYLVWNGSLAAGERLSEVSVTYSNDSYAFDTSKFVEDSDYYDYDYDDSYYHSSSSNDNSPALLFSIVWIAFMIFIIVRPIRKYSQGSGFSSGNTTKKITRTLIKYHPNCPGCGATRTEGMEKCEYCGRSFIASEEVVEEKEITEPDKYKEEGLFSYGGDSNTYIRVHVTHVPVPKSTCVHSSCAHSSCACAHSCACACACACAGGGRAGCSTKDFYNTGLKLKQLERRKNKK